MKSGDTSLLKWQKEFRNRYWGGQWGSEDYWYDWFADFWGHRREVWFWKGELRADLKLGKPEQKRAWQRHIDRLTLLRPVSGPGQAQHLMMAVGV